MKTNIKLKFVVAKWDELAQKWLRSSLMRLKKMG